jgi:cell division protease FtsH
VAYHEAGHAVVACSLPDMDMPHKISIIPSGNLLGQSWLAETYERVLLSRSGLIEEMAVLLGGRVAEEMTFGQPSSGPSNDLERVGEIARAMVRELGMSEAVGPLVFESNGRSATPAYSDETAQLIDREARVLVEQAEERARLMLGSAGDALERVAQALLDQEVLSSHEIQEIVGKSNGKMGSKAEEPAKSV